MKVCNKKRITFKFGKGMDGYDRHVYQLHRERFIDYNLTVTNE